MAKQKKRCPGGAWRQYVAQQTRGSKGLPRLTQLAEQYAALPLAERAELQVAGSLATAAARLDPGNRRRGIDVRQVRARAQLRLDMAHWERSLAAGLDEDHRQLAVVAHGEATGTGVKGALAMARAHRRMDLAKVEQERAEGARALQTYVEGAGKVGLDLAQAAMPAANLGGLIPVPSPPGLYCMRFQPPLLDTAESVMSVLGANHRATNMARCLDEDWRRRHTTLMHDTCPPCGPTVRESRCKTAGVCLCCPSGKLLLTFSNRFIQAIKQVCPVDSDNRKLLANGKLVALLQGTPAEREGQDGQEHPQGTVHNQLFFHIALQYFSPYRPTFHMVLPAAAPPGEPAADERRLYVQATPSGG